MEPKCPLCPLGDRVIVVADEKQKMAGLIHLPDQAAPPPQCGTVVAVGPGSYSQTACDQKTDGTVLRAKPVRIPMSLSVGQRVWFTRYGGSAIEIDKVEYRVFHESEILCVHDVAPDAPK